MSKSFKSFREDKKSLKESHFVSETDLPGSGGDKKVLWLSLAAVGALALVAVLSWFLVFAPKNNLEVNEKVKEEVQQTERIPQSEQSGVLIEEQVEDNILPRKYDEWEVANEEDLEDLDLPLKRNINVDLFSTATPLPSSAEGYTDDPDDFLDSSGNLNPMFTSITEETFFKQTARIVEIFLNPVFGGWEELQYPTEEKMPVSETSGYPFTMDWLISNGDAEAKEALPVLADTGNNDYGLDGKIREEGPRWVGDLKSGSLEMTYDEESLNYIAKFNGNIEFLSYNSDDSDIIKKDGVLTMTLVTTEEGEVLVSDALLEVG